MSSNTVIHSEDSVYEKLLLQCIDIYKKNELKNDVYSILISLMDNKEVPMHYPYHHFILPASLLTASCMVERSSEIELKQMLEVALKRSKAVLGGFCGSCGACGSGIGAGIFMSVYTDTTTMSEDTWKWSNEITGVCLQAISKIPGPRCCKRTVFLSAQAAIQFIKDKLGIELFIPDNIVCKYYERNKECKKELCPFYKV